MIKFKQKEFSEADAMRPFYVKLQRDMRERKCPFVQVIGKSEMLPILSGNNVIIEKFVLVDKILGKDRFRMYLRFGSKVKLPDVFKLSEFEYRDKPLFGASKLNVNLDLGSGNGGGGNNNNNGNNKKNKNKNNQQKKFSEGSLGQKEFGFLSPKLEGLSFAISRTVKNSLGEVTFYDKKNRIATIEFSNIQDAIKSLNILPLGLNYKLYLLDV